MEVISPEFNTLRGTRIYAHSSAKAYFESYHSDNGNILTAVLAEAYTESPISIYRESHEHNNYYYAHGTLCIWFS